MEPLSQSMKKARHVLLRIASLFPPFRHLLVNRISNGVELRLYKPVFKRLKFLRRDFRPLFRKSIDQKVDAFQQMLLFNPFTLFKGVVA